MRGEVRGTLQVSKPKVSSSILDHFSCQLQIITSHHHLTRRTPHHCFCVRTYTAAMGQHSDVHGLVQLYQACCTTVHPADHLHNTKLCCKFWLWHNPCSVYCRMLSCGCALRLVSRCHRYDAVKAVLRHTSTASATNRALPKHNAHRGPSDLDLSKLKNKTMMCSHEGLIHYS